MHYQQLGDFSDWVDEARRQGALFPVAPPGPTTQARLRDVLGFCGGDESARDVRVERRWRGDGVEGEEVSWSVGFGPRTRAFVLRPEGATGALPGLLALHCHGGYKYFGKEKIADDDGPVPPSVAAYRQRLYAGRAYANHFAAQGFVVVVHDAFTWGSRRFALDAMPPALIEMVGELMRSQPIDDALEHAIARYNLASGHHENVAAKYCNVLGTSMAGVVSYEDRVAFNYLRSRPDVDADRSACIGLSGGGNRAALLNATHDGVRAAGIVGLMSTYEGLLDHNVTHTWMLFPPNWSRYGEWPDIAACRAPSPLLVQYDLDDHLFTEEGMRAADARLNAHYAGSPGAYTGQFYPGPHKFDLDMQHAALDWLKRVLA